MEALPFMRNARSWIEIDLDAIAANYRTAREVSAPCARVCAVLKADAYGHGAARVARRLVAEGADFFAVSCVREGLALRRAGIAGTVLVMGALETARLSEALAEGLTLTLGSAEEARTLSEAAAVHAGPVGAHIKIDAGFHRLGLPIGDPKTVQRIQEIYFLPYLSVEGIYAHLPLRSAEEDAAQAARMHALCTELQARHCAPPLLHLVDSIGLVRYPQWHHNLVRIGALLFGAGPLDAVAPKTRPTLRFCTAITRLHWAEAGECVGYDDAHPLSRATRIATLSVGYGDGYPRAMGDGSGRALVSIRGRRAPVLGRVCMDQCMVDVTDIPGVALGDEAELFGRAISLAEYAAWADTNRNEAMVRLSRRPPRAYYAAGELIAVEDALLGREE